MHSRLYLAPFVMLSAMTACSGSDSTPSASPEGGIFHLNPFGGSPGNSVDAATGDEPADDTGSPANPGMPGTPPMGTQDASAGSGTTDDAGGPTGTGTPNVDGGPSTGCGKVGAATGDFTVTTTFGGVSRTYQVFVSKTYSSNTPVPLVFVFHGLNGTAAGAEGFGLQNGAAAANQAAVFAFPQGVQMSGGVGWDVSCSGKDVGFFDAIRAKLESQYCIQANRVFVTGFSWGGDFTHALGCCRGDVIRAIAPASGALYTNTASCTSATPAYRLTSGSADPYYGQSEFSNAAGHFAKANGCTTQTSPVSPSPCVAYGSCSRPVLWCSYSGMGHQLPTNWPTETWAFLSKFM